MKKFNALFLMFVVLPVYAEITDEDRALDCLKIKTYAAQGDGFYKQHNYKKARALYESQVAWSESCQLEQGKITMAYNNVALTYIHENNYLMANAWLQIDPDDTKSIYNLNLIKDKLPAAKAAVSASPEGEYWQYAGNAIWNSLIVTPENKKYRIDFSGAYAGAMAMYGGINMGEFSVSVAIVNNRASYLMAEQSKSLDCVYEFSFAGDFIDLAKLSGSECGFGFNVTAEGSYIKVSR